MANNYVQFSEIIDELTPEEILWLKENLPRFTEWDEETDNSELAAPACKMELVLDEKTPHLWLHSDECSLDETKLGLFIKEFFGKFRPNEVFALTYACTCSKMRTGEFSGGAMVFSRLGATGWSAYDWAREAEIQMRIRLKGEPS